MRKNVISIIMASRTNILESNNNNNKISNKFPNYCRTNFISITSLSNDELNQMTGIHLKAYVVKNVISRISSILFHSKIFDGYSKIK